MSIEKIDYVVVGLEIVDNVEKLSDDEFEKIENLITTKSNGKLEMIYDGMCGEYCIVGRTLKMVKEYDDSYDSFKINYKQLKDITKDVQSELINLFGEIDFLPENIFKNEVDLHSFTHYV